MVALFQVISRTYVGTCVRLVLTAQRHANLCLFFLGVSLLCIGLESLSHAGPEPKTQGKTAEVGGKAGPDTKTDGKIAEAGGKAGPEAKTTGQASEAATGRLAEGAVGRLAEGALMRPAEVAIGRLAEQALGTPAELGASLPAEANDVPYDDTLIRNSVGNLFKFIEGAFGALLVVGAGIGAIIAATLGAYKAALALLVVSVGAFILRSYVSLFFGTNYPDYEIGDF